MSDATVNELISRLDARIRNIDPIWRFPAEGLEMRLSEIRERSLGYAAVLQDLGVDKGDRVGLLLQNSSSYVALLLAVWRLNAIAVPLASKARRDADLAQRLRDVDEVCGFRLIVHDGSAALPGREACTIHLSELGPLASRGRVQERKRKPSDVAVLQFSSGSTGNPKAVIVTHGMMMAQLQGMHDNHLSGCRVESVRSTASWLPIYHDMGLFIGVLHPIFEMSANLLAPPSFYLKNAARWFGLMASHEVDFSFTTNSALAASLPALRRLAAAGIDLSELRLYVAAEKVSAVVLREATRILGAFGMREGNLRVGYGMAENALGCASTRSPSIVTRHFLFGDDKTVRLAQPGVEDAVELVSVGRAYLDQEVSIRDERGNPLPELEVGEIHVAGPCVTPGYYRNPRATERALVDGRLATGDLGFYHEGELYFYARKDDLIVIAGRNIVPDDVEQAVERLDFVRTAGACLFLVENRTSGVGELVLLVEPRRGGDEQELARLRARVQAEVYQATDVLVHRILVCPKGTVEKTTSGKKRRKVLRERYRTGRIQPLEAHDACEANV